MKNLYALLDHKANAVTSIHAIGHDAEATRAFAEAVLQQGSVYGRYPDDFALVCIGQVRDLEGPVVIESPLAAHEDTTVSSWVVPSDIRVVVTARQVVDLHAPKADPAQLQLIKEA